MCGDFHTEDFADEVLKRFWKQAKKPFDISLDKLLRFKLKCFVDNDHLVLGEDYKEDVKDLINHGNDLLRRV